MNENNDGEGDVNQRRRQKPGKSKDKAANPIRNTLQTDIENLLLRFFLSSPSGLSSLSFDSFKECWSVTDKHFTLIHYTFATSRVDYNKLLQTMFQLTLSYLDHVPIEKLQQNSPSLYGPNVVDFELLSAAWNMSVVFCLYCMHGTQFEVNYQDSKASNKSHMEITVHSELEEKTPIRIAMSMYMRLVITTRLQFLHFFNTQLGRCAFAVLDHLMNTNAFCFSAFTGPILYEEFDEKPGNNSNHIIETIDLEELLKKKKKQYAVLMKKKDLIAAIFPGHFRAENQSSNVARESVMEMGTDDSALNASSKARNMMNQIPSRSRRPVYIGYKGSKVQDNAKKKTNVIIQKSRKDHSSKRMEDTTMERTAELQVEATSASKSSDALAEELAAMFDVPSSSADSLDNIGNSPVVTHDDTYQAHIAELQRLEKETDEVLTMGSLETVLENRSSNGNNDGRSETGNRRVRSETSSRKARSETNSRRVRKEMNPKRSNVSSEKRRERRKDTLARNHIDILKDLEENLHEILDS